MEQGEWVVQRVEQLIYVVRGQRVMLSSDLAELYDVQPKALIQAVKRNIDRFPPDLMFPLSRQEFTNLKSRRLLVEEEQSGEARATYGRRVIEAVSERLTAEFGRGFDKSNCGTCGPFTSPIQKPTHCVENCPGPITACSYA